jgi:hypothetical protein
MKASDLMHYFEDTSSFIRSRHALCVGRPGGRVELRLCLLSGGRVGTEGIQKEERGCVCRETLKATVVVC